jgi:hypothetical protein
LLNIIEQQESLKHNQNKIPVCACFGRINKVDKGYNVVPKIFDAIEVDVFEV